MIFFRLLSPDLKDVTPVKGSESLLILSTDDW